MRVLVFGDSITQGYWDTEGGWVERIRKFHDSKQVTNLEGLDEPTIFNFGISADNSNDILNRIEPETISRTRHDNLPIVIIQIGVNDSSIDRLPGDESVSLPIEKYEQNLKAIINKIKTLSSKIIFIGLSACNETRTTPVSWGDFYYTNEAIKKYENKMKDIAAECNCEFIPVFDAFIQELDKEKDLLLDGLHPNNEGHAFMYKVIMKELARLLV
ncbi:MAG: GDSL-type esterase/lipase family protein [Candidatus Saccharibacteria bacterium]|nr:GDSL-type esterase/lipase family protein [Candidatus Saccharibacteria bacterium]